MTACNAVVVSSPLAILRSSHARSTAGREVERDSAESRGALRYRGCVHPQLRDVPSSEVQTLEWRQVDFKAGTVRLEVGTTKNEAVRMFPFDVLPELCDLVEEQAAVTEAVEQRQGRIVRRVFHRDGRPIKDFRRAWKTACEAAGCPGCIPHDFRRTAARNLIRTGVSDKVAMELTGHKARSVFDRYDIVNEADLREGVRKLGQMKTVTVSVTVAQSGKIRRLRRSS